MEPESRPFSPLAFPPLRDLSFLETFPISFFSNSRGPFRPLRSKKLSPPRPGIISSLLPCSFFPRFFLPPPLFCSSSFLRYYLPLRPGRFLRFSSLQDGRKTLLFFEIVSYCFRVPFPYSYHLSRASRRAISPSSSNPPLFLVGFLTVLSSPSGQDLFSLKGRENREKTVFFICSLSSP